jgi:glycosyltransferase involved in cell wall biosynthesis
VSRDVIISNGFNRFPLAPAAAEMDQRGLLDLLLTGAYPTPFFDAALRISPLQRWRKLQSFKARQENIDPKRVRAFWFSESVYQLAAGLRLFAPARRLSGVMDRAAHKLYGRYAARRLKAEGRSHGVYHYRAGFGHASVIEAKKLGQVTVCDHSLPHPAVLEYLISHDGELPPLGQSGSIDELWRDIQRDIEQADIVLLNSEFLRQTFLNQGWNEVRLRVIYPGVDEKFLQSIPTNPDDRPAAGPARLLFVGSFERRKGAHILARALRGLQDEWELDIVGSVLDTGDDDVLSLLRDPRVKRRGIVPRAEIPRYMTAADAFVFPSLAEGSVRAVFEAAACGCYIITTPNSVDQIEGLAATFVQPGNVSDLRDAIRDAIRARNTLPRAGRQNSDLIRSRFTKQQYGDQLEALYADVRTGALAR